MSKINNALYNMKLMDDLAKQDTFIHKLHPLIKLITTIVYLLIVVSFGRFEVSRLLPLSLYLVVVFSFSELPLKPLVKRILLMEPLIIGMGIMNPIWEYQNLVIFGITLSKGWLVFLSIFIKGSFTASAALLLIATTGMDKIAVALRMLRIPRLIVLQLVLTYRYVSVLMEEVGRIFTAYLLRAPGQKGVHPKAWGSLAGQLLIRTFDRGQRVYQAMCLRGFQGEYITVKSPFKKSYNLLYLMGWLLFFILVRCVDIPNFIGQMIVGGQG